MGNPFENIPKGEFTEKGLKKEEAEEEKREMTREQMDKMSPSEFAEVKTFIEGLEKQGIEMKWKMSGREFSFQQLVDDFIKIRESGHSAEYSYLGEIIKEAAGFTKSKEDEAKILKNLDRLKELLESRKAV